MRRIAGIAVGLLLTVTGVVLTPATAHAVTASVTDPTSDVTGADGTYDITSVDVTLTTSTFSATVHTAAPLPSLSDSSWAADSSGGREIAINLGLQYGFSGIGVIRNQAVAVDANLNEVGSCPVTAAVSGGALTVSTPASCFNNPGRVDVFVSSVDLSHPGDVVDIAIAGPIDTATDLTFVTAALNNSGYYQAASDGGVFAFGGAPSFGGLGGQHLNAPIVGLAKQSANQLGTGYRMVATDGGIFCFGNNGAVGFYCSMGGSHLNRPIVGMTTTPSGSGYWLVASDGGIFAYGDAAFYGSMGGSHLNQPIVGMTVTASGKGYWLVASDGGIFAYGDAAFYGSTGSIKLNSPIVGMTSTSHGYVMAARDGGIFAYGDAVFRGSGVGFFKDNVVGIASNGANDGYYLTSSDGQVGNYGSALAYGSIANLLFVEGKKLNKPVVGIGFSG